MGAQANTATQPLSVLKPFQGTGDDGLASQNCLAVYSENRFNGDDLSPHSLCTRRSKAGNDALLARMRLIKFSICCLGNRTGQKATFGTATREKQERVFGSEEHAKSIGGSSPYHRMNPGPATYTLQGGLGKQANSQKRTNTSWKIGTSLRSSIEGSGNTPGPGAYRNEYDGVGKQYLSRARTAPSAPFGTGTRDARCSARRNQDGPRCHHGAPSHLSSCSPHALPKMTLTLASMFHTHGTALHSSALPAA